MLTIPEPGVARVDDGIDTASESARLAAVDNVATQVLRTTRLTHLAWHALGKEYGPDIDPVGFRVLAQVITGGPVRLTALAEELFTDTSTMSRQTSAMVKAGLLERRPDAADGRASLLAATEKGERVFEHVRGRREELLGGLLDEWSEEDVHQLGVLLERYNRTLAQHYVPAHCADHKADHKAEHKAEHKADHKTVGPRAHTEQRTHANDQNDTTQDEGEGCS